MIKIAIIILVAVYVSGKSKNLNRHGRIIGGIKAELGQFPYQAELFLSLNGQHQCGASIIGYKWALTAGHCIDGLKEKDITLKVGIVILTKCGTIYSLQTLIPHPEYNLHLKANDIAIVQTITEITFTDLVKPIALAHYEIPVNSKVTASGWGYTSWGNRISLSNELYYLDLRTMCNIDCSINLIWVGKITDKNICTIGKYAEGICGGDSGGPLVHKNKLVGVISWGVPCGANYPDVYTKVSSYFNWINDIIL